MRRGQEQHGGYNKGTLNKYSCEKCSADSSERAASVIYSSLRTQSQHAKLSTIFSKHTNRYILPDSFCWFSLSINRGESDFIGLLDNWKIIGWDFFFF